jgi:hypothetical protein
MQRLTVGKYLSFLLVTTLFNAELLHARPWTSFDRAIYEAVMALPELTGRQKVSVAEAIITVERTVGARNSQCSKPDTGTVVEAANCLLSDVLGERSYAPLPHPRAGCSSSEEFDLGTNAYRVLMGGDNGFYGNSNFSRETRDKINTLVNAAMSTYRLQYSKGYSKDFFAKDLRDRISGSAAKFGVDEPPIAELIAQTLAESAERYLAGKRTEAEIWDAIVKVFDRYDAYYENILTQVSTGKNCAKLNCGDLSDIFQKLMTRIDDAKDEISNKIIEPFLYETNLGHWKRAVTDRSGSYHYGIRGLDGFDVSKRYFKNMYHP